MAEGRCMKCKKQVEIKDGKEVKMKNGMKAMKGVCGACGTKVGFFVHETSRAHAKFRDIEAQIFTPVTDSTKPAEEPR